MRPFFYAQGKTHLLRWPGAGRVASFKSETGRLLLLAGRGFYQSTQLVISGLAGSRVACQSRTMNSPSSVCTPTA